MKRISFYLVTVVCTFALLTPSTVLAANFSDVTHHKAEINYLSDKKVIQGYTDGTFKPAKPLTRLQAVTMLLRADGVTDLKTPNPKMTDMKPGNTGYAEVAKAVQLGIISGKVAKDGSSYFDPNGPLTRAEMAKILVESQKYKLDKTNAYSDVAPTNRFRDYISTLTAAGITIGYTDGTYKPNLAVTRQHFSVFVARMLDDVYKTPLKVADGSFMKDRTKKYTFSYTTNGKTSTAKIYYIDEIYKDSPQAEQWVREENGTSTRFLQQENSNGLYIGYLASEWDVDLKYPLFEGKRWDNYDESKDTTLYHVVSVDRTIKTPAGTFKNVVEVQSTTGWTEFYAPRVGVIKTLQKGKTFSELTKIEAR